MASFYILETIVEDDDLFVNEYDAPDEIEFGYSKGRPIARTRDRTRLFCECSKTKRKTDYLAGIHLFPIVSSNFMKLLVTKEVEDLEFHPVDLICEGTNEVGRSYYFMNVLNNIECFDRKNSKFETPMYDDQLIAEVYYLAINEEAIRGRDLVRMAEIPSTILVSDRLRTAIEASGLSGIEFMKLEDFEKI